MTVPEKKQMNAGVELLLKRMETHPEEFYVENQLRMGASKWHNLWHMYKDYLSEEDQEAYIDGVKAINQQRFTEHILEGLVDPKVSSGAENPHISPYLKNIASGGATQGGYTLTSNGTQPTWIASTSATGQTSINANSLTLGTATVDETALHELLHMKAQMELEKHKAKQVQRTLIGRLKNYLHNEEESK